jgi:hypothetical protein
VLGSTKIGFFFIREKFVSSVGEWPSSYNTKAFFCREMVNIILYKGLLLRGNGQHHTIRRPSSLGKWSTSYHTKAFFSGKWSSSYDKTVVFRLELVVIFSLSGLALADPRAD